MKEKHRNYGMIRTAVFRQRILRMSGPLQITTCMNGSLYGVDTGVEPHVRLNKAESFRDREALVERIRNLK